jgi:pilus assembly protein CpaD
MRLSSAIAGLTAALCALGGCAQSPAVLAQAGGGSTRLTAEVRTWEMRLAVSDDASIDAAQGERLEAFAAAYRRDGRSPLVISRPGGAFDAASLRAAEEARGLLQAAGVGPELIAVGAYDAQGLARAELILSYRTYETVVPQCPDLSVIDIARTTSNTVLPSFGCAVTAGLAAMIAYPEDLLAGREMDPADGGRRAVVLDKYRKGQPTATQKSDDASGTVSEAVSE